MKNTGKRLLALLLSVALLVGCAISGLVLPSAALESPQSVEVNLITNGNIDGDDWKDVTVADEGVGGSRALRVGASTVYPDVNFTLSEPLSAGKVYLFRFKVRGGAAQVWSQTGGYGTHKILAKQTSETEWTTAQFLFTPNAVHQNTLEFPAKHFYFYNRRDDKSTNANAFVYYDDFEIVEYVPGMNFFPAADGETLPYLGSTSGINAFEYFINTQSASLGNGGVTISLADDTAENRAWLFSNASGGYHFSLGMTSSVLKKGKEAVFSFRYKSANDTAAAVNIVTGDSDRSTVTSQASEPDENGWKTVTATMKLLKEDNYVYLAKMTFSGSSEVLIDDFYVGEKVEVQLDEDAVLIEEGNSQKLTATVTPSNAKVVWTSSDNSIATVDAEGNVTAVKPGNVTITATAQYGNADTCQVTVTEKPTIAIEQQEVSVVAGEFVALAYTATPENATITWRSSDEGIATVENGVVTGVHVGTATITAQITDTVKATCEVTVTPVLAGANLIVGGDFEGDYWNGKTNIVNGQGYGDQGNAFCVPQGTGSTNLPANLRLSQSLEAGKWYVLRFKSKGGFAQMYVTNSNAPFPFMTYYTSVKDSESNPVRTKTHGNYLHEDNWVQHYKVFQATEAMESLTEWGTSGLLLYNDRSVGAAVYYDDFEIVEYVPGMNLIPGSDGTLLPYATDSTQQHFFYPWLRDDMQISLAEDGECWEFSNLGEGLTSTPYLNTLANSVFPANSELTISFRYKGEGASVTVISASSTNSKITYSNTIEQEDGWKFYEVRFILLKRSELNSAVTFKFSGADTILMDDFYFAENTKLSVSDLTWTPNATQLKTDTAMSFSVKLTNNGVRPVSEGTDILVKLYARDGERTVLIDTLVHRGGLQAGESVVLATKTPWAAVAGEWVIAAQTNISVLGRVEKEGTQGNLRVADTLLTAPNEALAGGFDTLTFSDDFDTANVDTAYTGDYGYKWYLTDVTGISADADDFRLTGNSTMILEENGEIRYNWTMATIDAKTGAGWAGFRHGYLEFRIRFSRDALPGYDNVKNAPAIWSFPPERIAPSAYGTLELGVEMDWMEYWSTYWTITMHEQNRQNTQWMHNHNSYNIKGSQNDIGDNEWHTLGYRWEKGFLIAYLDGREIFYQSWSENGGNPAFTLQNGEFRQDAMMQLDNQTLVLILAGTEGKPLEIDYIRVWQKNEQNPYKFPVDNAETPVTELHWAPGTSSSTPLAGDKTVCWRTDNPTVASVDANGVIYTHSEGKALITAYQNGKAAAQYALTVDRYGERLPCGSLEMFGDDQNKVWYHDDSTYIIMADGKGSVVTESDGNHAVAMPAGKYGTLYGLSLERGKTYRLSGRVKGDAGATLLLLNDINLYDSTSASSEKQPVASGKAGEWVEFSYTFSTTKVDEGAYVCSKGYTVYLKNSGSTTAYYDDLSLVETDGFVINGIGTRWEVTSVTKKSIFNYCFGPSLSAADYTVTITTLNGDTDILKKDKKTLEDYSNNTNTHLYTKAFGSTYVKVTATPSSGSALTKTVKVSVVGGNMPLFTTPNTTVKFQNSSGAALTSWSAGSTVKMVLTTESGYQPVAGSLRFTTQSGAQRRINNRDSADNSGNTFTFTVPSQKFVVSMQTASTAQTNFSVATVGTAVRYQEGTDQVNGVRFLTRLYVDGIAYNQSGRLVLTYNGTQYAVREMGSLLKRVSNTAELTLENARDTQYKNATSGNQKIWQTVCYKPNNNSLYALDSTAKYVDFAVSMLTNSPSTTFNNRRYEVCGYIELERADGSTFTVYSESMVDSVTQALARAAA